MKWSALVLCLIPACACWAASAQELRHEAEYYVAAYAQHYKVPVEFVRAIVEQESGWQTCPVSPKAAAGLMQLMPQTAARLGVRNLCDNSQNVSGGVRYLAWLMSKFHGDLRLVAAAYYAGEKAVERRGLNYSNLGVVVYVATVRQRFARQRRLGNVPVGQNRGRTRCECN